MRRKRAPRRIDFDFERLIAAVPAVAGLDAVYLADAFERASARLVKCRDGTFTARAVWRHRGAVVSAITCTVEGLTLR